MEDLTISGHSVDAQGNIQVFRPGPANKFRIAPNKYQINVDLPLSPENQAKMQEVMERWMETQGMHKRPDGQMDCLRCGAIWKGIHVCPGNPLRDKPGWRA